METQLAKTLIFHGSIVLLFGILSGFPFWLAIIKRFDNSSIRAWRVAHTTLISYGLLIILISFVLPYLNMESGLFLFLKWNLLISGYSFVFALVIGALAGFRALTPTPFGINTIFYVGHLIGTLGSLMAICAIIYGLI